jgi:hypothetical protein
VRGSRVMYRFFVISLGLSIFPFFRVLRLFARAVGHKWARGAATSADLPRRYQLHSILEGYRLP